MKKGVDVKIGTRIKIFFIFIIIFLYKIFMKVEPMISKQFTQNQFSSSNSGYISYQLYTSFIDNLWKVIFVGVLLLFIPEIKRLFFKLKRGI